MPELKDYLTEVKVGVRCTAIILYEICKELRVTSTVMMCNKDLQPYEIHKRQLLLILIEDKLNLHLQVDLSVFKLPEKRMKKSFAIYFCVII